MEENGSSCVGNCGKAAAALRAAVADSLLRNPMEYDVAEDFAGTPNEGGLGPWEEMPVFPTQRPSIFSPI